MFGAMRRSTHAATSHKRQQRWVYLGWLWGGSSEVLSTRVNAPKWVCFVCTTAFRAIVSSYFRDITRNAASFFPPKKAASWESLPEGVAL